MFSFIKLDIFQANSRPLELQYKPTVLLSFKFRKRACSVCSVCSVCSLCSVCSVSDYFNQCFCGHSSFCLL